MPSDPAAERAVLAGAFRHGGDAWADVSDLVTPQSFTVDTHQVIYRCLEKALSESPQAFADFASLMSAAHALGLDEFLNRSTERAVLKAVLETPVHLSNVRKLAAKVRKLEIGRLLEDQLEGAKKNIGEISGDESIEHILGLAEGPVFDFSAALSTSNTESPVLLGGKARAYVEYSLENPVKQIGLSSGFEIFDQAIGGGFRRGSVNVIAARIKQGKSTIADAVAKHVSGESQFPVLMMDTEMGEEEHLSRILAMFSGVPTQEIEKGTYGGNREKKEKVFKAVEYYERMKYYYKPIIGQPFEDTLAMMRRWLVKEVGIDENGRTKDCLIILDYIKLMNQAGMNDLQEYQAIGFLVTGLQNFMARYKVPNLSFVQLNREGEVAQSDRILWFCSNQSDFRWKTPEEKAEDRQQGLTNAGNCMLTVRLARHGGGLEDGDYINMQFDRTCAQIVERGTRNGLLQNKRRGEFVPDQGEFNF